MCSVQNLYKVINVTMIVSCSVSCNGCCVRRHLVIVDVDNLIYFSIYIYIYIYTKTTRDSALRFVVILLLPVIIYWTNQASNARNTCTLLTQACRPIITCTHAHMHHHHHHNIYCIRKKSMQSRTFEATEAEAAASVVFTVVAF